MKSVSLFKNVTDMYFTLYNKYNLIYTPYTHFDIFLVNYCNLNCKWCSRWCNVVKHRQIYKTEDIIRDTLNICSNVNTNYIGYNGGEPLLHPDIIELVKFLGELHRCFNVKTHILTNGKKILSMSDDFFKAVRENHVTISYTQYPESSGIKYDEIFKRLDDEQIKYSANSVLWGLPKGFVTETFCTAKYALDKSTDHSHDREFYLSCPRVCPSLWQGKLYKCCNTPFIDTLNDNCNTDFEIIENDDYLKIENIKSNKQLAKWYSEPSHFCSTYCVNSDIEKHFVPWSTGTNTAEELIIPSKLN